MLAKLLGEKRATSPAKVARAIQAIKPKTFHGQTELLLALERPFKDATL